MFFLCRGRTSQGVEVPSKLLARKFRYPSPPFPFFFEDTMAPKLVLPALGGIFHPLRHICLAVYGFPLDTVPVGTGQVLPFLINTGEAIGTQHGVGRKEEKSRVRDRVSHPVGLFLVILEFVDVLGDTLHVLMVRMHLVLDIENVRGMEANAHGLEMVQECARIHSRVE